MNETTLTSCELRVASSAGTAHPEPRLRNPQPATRNLLLATLLLLASPVAHSQTQIQTSINANQATTVIRIAVPFPDLFPAIPPAPGSPAPVAPTAELVNTNFFG
ncbi:MAG TPA: hypothetical protein VN605_06185, partial [Thermoanaerobaculia bacterium]|nr:hypothetical protein [Thermoanaerobaculia bacterium]